MSGKAILVLNAGSSSIKFLLFAHRDGRAGAAVCAGRSRASTRRRTSSRAPRAAIVAAEKIWGDGVALGHDGAVTISRSSSAREAKGIELEAVGHRVVHGGPDYARPVRMDREVLAALERLVPLAPLHQPHNLAPIRMLLERRPDLPQVACFDTAFHSTNPDVAQRFAIPADLHDAGVRRYGFHGLSYEYIASVLAEHDDACGGRQDRRVPPGQRLEHVRDRGGGEHREHDGIHRARRSGHGHALGRASIPACCCI